MAITHPRGVASSPVLRLGLKRKTERLLEAIAENATASARREPNVSVRLYFDQAIEDLRWSWDHFGDDLLARAICWRFPIALDKLSAELAGGFSGVPITRTLLIQMCERGIEAAHLVGDARLRDNIQCALASRAGSLYLEMDNPKRCAELLTFAHSIAQSLSDKRLLGRILSLAAELYLTRREFDAAKATFARSVAVARQSRDAPGEAVAMFGVGKVCRVLDERLEAAEWLKIALHQTRELGLPAIEGKVIQELGELWISLGEFGAAIQCYEDAVSRAVDSYARGQARLALGKAWLASGSLKQARQVFAQAESDARASGDRITSEEAVARRGELTSSYRRLH